MDRLKLHNELLKFCKNVYFQAPMNTNIRFPHIKYSRVDRDDREASNLKYMSITGWNLLVVTKDIEDPIVDKILDHFPTSRLATSNQIDGLYQTTIIIKTL